MKMLLSHRSGKDTEPDMPKPETRPFFVTALEVTPQKNLLSTQSSARFCIVTATLRPVRVSVAIKQSSNEGEKREQVREERREKKAAERKAQMKKAAERNEILLSNLQVENEILKVKNEILDVLRTDGRTPVADAAAGGSALAHD